MTAPPLLIVVHGQVLIDHTSPFQSFTSSVLVTHPYRWHLDPHREIFWRLNAILHLTTILPCSRRLVTSRPSIAPSDHQQQPPLIDRGDSVSSNVKYPGLVLIVAV